MSAKPDRPCLANYHSLVKKFLKTFRGRLVDKADIAAIYRAEASRRGEDWPWVAKWVEEEGPKWVNDMETVVFEVPLSNLTGRMSLHFTQQAWMSQPSLFEYTAINDRGIVRMWWDRSRGAFPYTAAS